MITYVLNIKPGWHFWCVGRK